MHRKVRHCCIWCMRCHTNKFIYILRVCLTQINNFLFYSKNFLFYSIYIYMDTFFFHRSFLIHPVHPKFYHVIKEKLYYYLVCTLAYNFFVKHWGIVVVHIYWLIILIYGAEILLLGFIFDNLIFYGLWASLLCQIYWDKSHTINNYNPIFL